MSSRENKRSTNFNTDNMRVVIFSEDDDGPADQLDRDSFNKLLQLADYTIDKASRKKQHLKTFIVINPNVAFTSYQAGKLRAHFEDNGHVKAVSIMNNAITIITNQGQFVTVDIVGGARFIVECEGEDKANTNDDKEDEEDEDSDFKDVTGQGLTQECSLYRGY